jgi:hypothetical protein
LIGISIVIVGDRGAAPHQICTVCVSDLPVAGATISLVAKNGREAPIRWVAVTAPSLPAKCA